MPDRTERIERLRTRLKDIIWAIGTRYGYRVFLDKFVSYLAFDRKLTDQQFDDLFLNYPQRAAANFSAALLPEIEIAMRSYRAFYQTGKQFHRVHQQIVRLESLVRAGSQGCEFVTDRVHGYVLRLKK